MSMDPKLETRLRDIVERDEIWRVLLRYSRGIDRFDREMVLSCYWDDAIDDHHSFGGTPGQFLDIAIQYHREHQTITHHGLMNHSCELDGSDAHAETYYLFTGVNVELPHLMSMGRYIDHFQCRDGEWRIYSRVCVIEAIYALNDHPAAAFVPEDAGHGPVFTGTRSRDDLSYQRPVIPRTWGVSRE